MGRLHIPKQTNNDELLRKSSIHPYYYHQVYCIVRMCYGGELLKMDIFIQEVIVNNYYDRLYHTSCRYHTKLFIYIHLLALTSRDCPHLCVIVWPSDYCVIPH